MAHGTVATVDVERFEDEILRSFELVKPISSQVAAIFYPTMWEINPETKPLFKNVDMDQQGKKLMKVLGVAVTLLKKMDALVPMLQRLGRRHVSYGVKLEMYSSVGEALLIALEKGLGEQFTPETKEAWTWVYGVMSEVCIAAANEVELKDAVEKDEETAKPTSTTAPGEPVSKTD